MAQGRSSKDLAVPGLADALPQPIYQRIPLKVVLVALNFDYGRPELGLSYEYYNLYLCMKEIFTEVRFFDYHPVLLEEGKEQMNRRVGEFVRTEAPDLAIFPLFQDDEFDPKMIEDLQAYTTTLCYFFDDIWRVDFAEFWAPRFTYFTTAFRSCLLRYKDLGYDHAIFSPFGYNHFIYRNKALPKKYDATFIGGSHPYRSWVIKRLAKAGIDIHVWGGGVWPNGKLDQEAMIDVINQSRVCLNISNSVNWELPYLLSSPRALQVSIRSKKTKESIKGRNFELCGSGSFQLSYYAEGLEECFEIGKEIAIYMDLDDLVDKICYYLKHEEEREAIADAGYRRALSDHSYAKRFTEIAEHIFGPEVSR